MEVKNRRKKVAWNKYIPEYAVFNQVCGSKWNKELTFYGKDIDESCHEHRRAIRFENCVMKKLPKGLSKIFPNLEYLSVIYCGLEEISKEDLSGFKELKVLKVKNNELTSLPDNLFEENGEITHISFRRNKLIQVGGNILKPLIKLKSADFRDNLNINYLFKGCGHVRKSPSEHIFKLTEKSLNRLEVKIKKTECCSFPCSGGLNDDIDKLISTDEFKDFKILINGTEFNVHKFLFIARSPVLKELMKQDPVANSVTLEQIPVEIFKNILDFVYDNKFPSDDVVLETYAAAAKLQIQELKDYTASRLITLLNDDNALKILFMANEYKNSELKLIAFGHIRGFFPDKKLKSELANNPEAVRKLIAAKKEIEKLIEE